MKDIKETLETKNGQDISWQSVLKDKSLDSMFMKDRYLNPNHIFYTINGVLASNKNYLDINKSLVYEKICSEYQLTEDKIIGEKWYKAQKEGKAIEEERDIDWGGHILLIQPDLFVYLFPQDNVVGILYDSNIKKDILNNLIALIRSCPEAKDLMNKVYIIVSDVDGLRLDHFKMDPYKVDLHLNYEDDFSQVHETIIERLHKEKDKGLVLLHGKPGTGKTTYLRHLISQTTKRVIYVSPDFAEVIASPTFMGLLINYPDSILVIEDAENIIEQRKGGKSVAVSNLLNISDGLLSDCLNIQLICSFNNDINKIDSALLRKGRLIAKYEFKALSIGKGQALSDSLGFTTKIEKAMTLGEIYNQSEEDFEMKGERKKIGY